MSGSKKLFLVTGDSYSILDNKSSHWAKIWAERNGADTEHHSFPGNNHVNISNYIRDLDYSKYSGVIYHITDFFRSEVVAEETYATSGKSRHMLMKINEIESLSSNNYYLKRVLTDKPGDGSIGRFITAKTQSWMLYKEELRKDTTKNFHRGHDEILMRNAEMFYHLMGIEWLFKANWNAFELALSRFKIAGLPTIVVLPWIARASVGFNCLTQEEIPYNFYLWAQPCPGSIVDAGDNHLSIDNMVEYAKMFDTLNQERKFFDV